MNNLDRHKFTGIVGDRGVAMIELAIVLPFMLLIMVGTFELGRVLNQYLILTQIAYEGIRAGSQMTDVEPACFGDFVFGGDPANDAPLSPAELSHKVVLERVGYMLGLQQAGLSMKCDSTIDSDCASNSAIANLPTATSEYYPATGPGVNCSPPAKKGNLVIKLSGKYQPLLLPSTFTLPLHVEATSVLLMENEGLTATGGAIPSVISPVETAPIIPQINASD